MFMCSTARRRGEESFGFTRKLLCRARASFSKIYNKFDLNYIDEFGLTHFHVACRYGCADVVQKFLDFGQDPNLLVREIDDSPLLLALNWRHEEVAELLLRRGADLNLRNAEGSTPLHIICHRYRDDNSAELLFKINKELHRPVQLDVADNYGRTPLQLAVANILPNTVDVLLSNGADLSSFVFPADSYFCEEVKPPEHGIRIKFELRLASGALLIVESLEKSGYELDRSDALTIMKFFAKRGLFEKSSDLEKHWYDDGELYTHAGFRERYAYINYRAQRDILIRQSAPLGAHFDVTASSPFFPLFFFFYIYIVLAHCANSTQRERRRRRGRRDALHTDSRVQQQQQQQKQLEDCCWNCARGWHRKYAGTTAAVIIQRRYKREIRKNTMGLRRASGKRKRVVELMTRRAATAAADDDERNELITARCSLIARVIDRCSSPLSPKCQSRSSCILFPFFFCFHIIKSWPPVPMRACAKYAYSPPATYTPRTTIRSSFNGKSLLRHSCICIRCLVRIYTLETSDDYSRGVYILASSEESNVHRTGNVKFYSASIASVPQIQLYKKYTTFRRREIKHIICCIKYRYRVTARMISITTCAPPAAPRYTSVIDYERETNAAVHSSSHFHAFMSKRYSQYRLRRHRVNSNISSTAASD
ncbi:unnamed protein product [Trichogramma brassicae]|uniref:Uncharacterized protein n=1 Tax=Trichogramma brassicae TaxID=86971 RepID=A0A6H5IQK4_9HYME|nr:unnamed protein product [Trichogramma brassicae]